MIRKKTAPRKTARRKTAQRKTARRKTVRGKTARRKAVGRRTGTSATKRKKSAPAGHAARSGVMTGKTERVVVDEIMENGKARILRAPRLPGFPDSDLSMDTWGDEAEDAITVWKLEAYVGFKAPRTLKEGDVFFIRDGSNLNEQYAGAKVIKRDTAAGRHLIGTADESREQARKEIKERFYNLTAQRIGRNRQDRQNLSRIIRMRVWKGQR